jgi:hypothetical protein
MHSVRTSGILIFSKYAAISLVFSQIHALGQKLASEILTRFDSLEVTKKITTSSVAGIYRIPVKAGISFAHRVFRGGYSSTNGTVDGSGFIRFSADSEISPDFFGAAESWTSCIALLCSSTSRCSLICERPGPCYGGAVFIGDDLAVQSSPRSPPPHRQSAVVALVQRRRQPHALGSINKHEHSGYACRSKHFLFRPCLFA